MALRRRVHGPASADTRSGHKQLDDLTNVHITDARFLVSITVKW